MTQALIPLHILGESEFDRRVIESAGAPLEGLSIDTVQVNIGLRCNLACHHCHVESSPARKEEMSWETMQRVLDAAQRSGAGTIDITGGAPEMHPHFRRFVSEARAIGRDVIVRTNLTILLEEGFEDLPDFFRKHKVHLIASLPCYLQSNVDKQRGRGVYLQSIEAIRRLNAIGYGIEPSLALDLVFNPGGASLPPGQEELEETYRRELLACFGIRFTRLLTITNIAIGRFLHDLQRQGKARRYQQLLRDSFNPGTLDELMCRHQLHVGWDGTLYDCDFNFALSLPARGRCDNIGDFEPKEFLHRQVATGGHCFACTAGAGSSCGGALTGA